MLKISSLSAIVLLSICNQMAIAEQTHVQTIITVERKDWRDDKNDDKTMAIPLIMNINGLPTYNRAWLNLSNGMRFVFSENNQTLDDISIALSGRVAAKKFTLTCGADLLASFCQKYSVFVLHFDYNLGEISLIYQSKSGSGSLVDNGPLTSINQSIYYSESKYNKNSYRSGLWNATTNTGITENTVLGSSVRYDFQRSQMSMDTLTLKQWIETSKIISLLYSKYPQNGFGRVGGENFRGVSLSRDSSPLTEGGSNVEPIIIDSDYDGIFNVYDQYGNMVNSFPAKRGINRIDISPGTAGQLLKIELVVDGSVMKTYERSNPQEQSNNGYDISAGIADITKNKNKNKNSEIKNENITNTPFMRIRAGSNQLSVEGGSMPEAKVYYISARTKIIDTMSFSSESIYKDNKLEHTILLSYSNAWKRLSYFGNYIKNISNISSNTYSAGFTYALENNDRVSVYYNGSSRSQNKENRFSMNYNTWIDSTYGRFDIGLSAGTNFDTQKSIGVNLIYRPSNNSGYLKPALNMAWQNNMFTTSLSNEMEISKNISATPTIQFNQGESTRYGSVIDINNEYQTTTSSIYKNNKGSDISFSSNSTVLLSSKGVNSSSDMSNAAYYFENELKQEKNNNKKINMTINGMDNKITNHLLTPSFVGDKGQVVNVYSKDSTVKIDSDSQNFIARPYRLYTIRYKENDDVMLVFGRIINDETPVNGVSIVNHASRTISDDKGYFSLTVSKKNPTIELFQDNKICNSKTLENYKNSHENIFIGRIECRAQT